MNTELKIVGDIGGTNARFACVTDEGNFYHKLEILACVDYPEFEDALLHYIDLLKQYPDLSEHKLQEVCLAIAGPVYNDIVDLPNNHWA